MIFAIADLVEVPGKRRDLGIIEAVDGVLIESCKDSGGRHGTNRSPSADLNSRSFSIHDYSSKNRRYLLRVWWEYLSTCGVVRVVGTGMSEKIKDEGETASEFTSQRTRPQYRNTVSL